MKVTFCAAVAAAALMMVGATSASAAVKILGTSQATAPTIDAGDIGYILNDVGAGAFAVPNFFDMGPSGSTEVATESLEIPFFVSTISNISASIYDLTSGAPAVTLTSGNGTFQAVAGDDYKVVVSGFVNGPAAAYSLALKPVPGPAGALVALGGLGAILLRRRVGKQAVAA